MFFAQCSYSANVFLRFLEAGDEGGAREDMVREFARKRLYSSLDSRN